MKVPTLLRRWSALAACWCLTACDSRPPTPQQEAAPTPAPVALPPSGLSAQAEQVLRERGQAIVAQAGTLLGSNLLAAIQARGVTNALSYCSVQALPLAGIIATNHQVELRRVSHRARNPQGQADAFEAEVLRRFQAALAPNQPPAPVLTSNRADTITCFAPIVVNNPLCLRCHGQPGTEVFPAHLAFIRGLYPQDAATGFKMGDLRGAWRIDFPRAALDAK
jgi:hypothetical protein